MAARSLVLTSVGLAGAALAACTPPHPHWHGAQHSPLKTIARLDCPDSEDSLTRTTQAADGLSCAYAGPNGALVQLQLVNLAGADPKTALAPIEADLRSEMPASAAAGSNAVSNSGVATQEHDSVNIDLPGVHIHANDQGANVQAGGANVQADNHGAEVHTEELGSGVRLNFLLASETPGPHGFRVAAYVARGPASGPVAVAVIKEKAQDEDDDARRAAESLLRRNVG